MKRFEIQLSFEGPVLSAGVGAHRVDLDAQMRRNAEGYLKSLVIS